MFKFEEFDGAAGIIIGLMVSITFWAGLGTVLYLLYESLTV
jgi:hypothetical protein